MLAPVYVSSSQRKDGTGRVSRAPPDLVIAVDFLVSLGTLPDRRMGANLRAPSGVLWPRRGVLRSRGASLPPSTSAFQGPRHSGTKGVAIDEDASLLSKDFGHEVQIPGDLR